MTTKKQIFDEAEFKFGKACYVEGTRDLEDGYIRIFAYRDSGSMYSMGLFCDDVFRSDSELISDFLSKLSHQELNYVDERVRV